MAGMPQPRRRSKNSDAARQAETARDRRNKRADEAQKKVQYATERPRHRSDHTPVVTRRSSMYDMATPMHAAGSIRRRIDIPIGRTGGEFTLPALPMVHFGWRAVSALLFVLMAVCAGLLVYSPAFRVAAIEVEGLNRVPLEEITLAAGIVDSTIISIDPQKLHTSLAESFPEFSQINISIGLPASVKISVVERTPVLRWFNDSGEHWVDLEGFIFPARGDGSALPVVEADILPGITEENLAILAGLRTGPAGVAVSAASIKLDTGLIETLLYLSKNIPDGSPLFYSPERGFGWTDNHDWVVYFGAQQTDLEQKQIVYAAIVNYLVEHNLKPALVSVENPHAPYFRMER